MRKLNMYSNKIIEYHLLIFFFCCLVACKGQTTDNTPQKTPVDAISCNEKLKILITTCSNFDNPFRDILLTKMEKNGENTYMVELCTDDSGENSTNTVGWVQLNLSDNTLIEITEDLQDGKALNYDKELYDKYLSECLGINSTKDTSTPSMVDENLQVCKLPIDFDDYYSVCIYPVDTKKCQERYPKYPFKNNNKLIKILEQNKYESPEEYILLPLLNNTIQPVILCFTETDIERYVLIIIQNNKLISQLEIGKMNDNESKWFYIDENYKITIYKGDKNNIWKTFKMTDDGNFFLL
ncbi:hypothetical protein AGMMS50239_40700 [Bacteroidia bacterium]|nr:hypothetical protein AGMMS50239_40700 [Bacteroidia bacterium]